MFSSTTHVCIVDLMCIVDHIVSVGMLRMRRNYCRSIPLLWYPPSHSLWINLWTCMVSELSCHLREATIVWTPALSVVYICVCWPPMRRVYAITSLLLQNRKHLLLLCCLAYLPSQGVNLLSANVGRHSLCSHCQGYH